MVHSTPLALKSKWKEGGDSDWLPHTRGLDAPQHPVRETDEAIHKDDLACLQDNEGLVLPREIIQNHKLAVDDALTIKNSSDLHKAAEDDLDVPLPQHLVVESCELRKVIPLDEGDGEGARAKGLGEQNRAGETLTAGELGRDALV